MYAYPHQNHATMEPMNATAKWTPERCEVWTPTQNGEAALGRQPLKPLGLPPAQCEVYKIHLGGGFGRRGAVHDWVTHSAVADRQGDCRVCPSSCCGRREEDMTHGLLPPHHAMQVDGRRWMRRATCLRCTCGCQGKSILARHGFPQNGA